MDNDCELLGFYRSPLSDKLKKTAAPLQECFGIDGFAYSLITPKGKFYQICNQPTLSEFYFSNKFYKSNPLIHHPASYCTSTFFLSDLEDGTFKAHQQIMEKEFGCGEERVLAMYKKQGQNGQLFLFFTTNKNFTAIPNFLSNLPLLDKFCFYFLSEWRNDFKKLDRFALNIPEILGQNQFRCNPITNSYSAESKIKRKFLHKLGIVSHLEEPMPQLSTREHECLVLLLEGKTAKQMAQSLTLSARTVEHYIDNIKNKFGCLTKSELFTRVSDLRLLGY